MSFYNNPDMGKVYVARVLYVVSVVVLLGLSLWLITMGERWYVRAIGLVSWTIGIAFARAPVVLRR